MLRSAARRCVAPPTVDPRIVVLTSRAPAVTKAVEYCVDELPQEPGLVEFFVAVSPM